MSVEGKKNSPGNRSVVPYSNSAAVQEMSSYDGSADAEKDERQRVGPVSRALMSFESALKLTVEAFHQAIRDGMVGRRVDVLGAKQFHQLAPQVRLELSAAICGQGRRYPESRNPSGHKGLCHSLSRAVDNGYGLGPTSKTIYARQDIDIPIGRW